MISSVTLHPSNQRLIVCPGETANFDCVVDGVNSITWRIWCLCSPNAAACNSINRTLSVTSSETVSRNLCDEGGEFAFVSRRNFMRFQQQATSTLNISVLQLTSRKLQVDCEFSGNYIILQVASEIIEDWL